MRQEILHLHKIIQTGYIGFEKNGGAEYDPNVAFYSGKTGKAVLQQNQVPYDYLQTNVAQELASEMSPEQDKTTSLMFGIQWDLICKYLEEKSELEQTDINENSKSWGNYTTSTITLNRGKYLLWQLSDLDDSELAKVAVWKEHNEDYIYSEDEETTITLVKDSVKNSNTEGIDVYLTTGASEQTKKMNIYDFAGNGFEWTLEEYDGLPVIRGGIDSLVSNLEGTACAAFRHYTACYIGWEYYCNIPINWRPTMY